MRGWVSLLLLTSLGVAGADPSARSRADKLFEDGRRYLAHKEYALACTAFEQSQDADPAIGTQLNIALCYEQWGHLAKAYEVFVDADHRATEAQDKRTAVARKHIAELEPKLARLHLDLPADADPYAIFLFDGKEIAAAALANELLLDAGPHTFESRVPGAPPSVKTIELTAGAREHVRIELASKPRAAAPELVGPIVAPISPITAHTERSKPRLVGGIVLVTGGAVAIGVASVIALGARSDYRAAATMCPARMCDSPASYQATRDALDRANSMTWVFVAGGAAAVIGGYLLATSSHESTDQPRVSATPVITPDQVGFAIGGTL